MIKQYELKRAYETNGRVYVGIPRERLYIPAFVDNRDKILMKLQQLKRSSGLFQREGHRVDRNRDGIVEDFLEMSEKPPWLQMLDSDMDHPINICERLSRWGKPIIGGLYFHRKESHDPFLFREAPKEKDKYGRTRNMWRPMRDEVYQFLVENNVPMMDGALTIDECKNSPLVECDAVATGAMMIHRSVLEHMKKPIFEYRENGASEDLQFCYEAKHDYGIPIYCDLSTISGHYIFSPQGQAQFRQKYQGRGHIFAGYSQNEAILWLAEFLDIDEAIAGDKIKRGSAYMAGDYWVSKFGKKQPTDKQARSFYEDPYVGELYLIELIHWNQTPVFSEFKSMLMPYRDMKVLEIGSGIGSIAIQLAVQKCEVTASEINDTLLAFSKFRENKIRKDITTEMEKIEFVKEKWLHEPSGTYDAVVAIDTFEHLTANQLKQMLKDIARVIKPGGNLVYHANFKQQDIYPMHFDHSKVWDSWLIEAGFIPLSQTHAMRGYSNAVDSESK